MAAYRAGSPGADPEGRIIREPAHNKLKQAYFKHVRIQECRLKERQALDALIAASEEDRLTQDHLVEGVMGMFYALSSKAA